MKLEKHDGRKHRGLSGDYDTVVKKGSGVINLTEEEKAELVLLLMQDIVDDERLK